METAILWNSTKVDDDLIEKIAARACDLDECAEKHQIMMSVTACHLNGCPLDLKRLLEADDFNFTHDVWGIHRYISKETGQLTRCFLPRFSSPNY